MVKSQHSAYHTGEALVASSQPGVVGQTDMADKGRTDPTKGKYPLWLGKKARRWGELPSLAGFCHFFFCCFVLFLFVLFFSFLRQGFSV